MLENLPKRIFVLGGANSGKSRLAEQITTGLSENGRCYYLATAQAWDDEMRAKIAAHQETRGSGWITLEAPLDITPPLSGLSNRDVVLLDCATMWLSNWLLADRSPADASAVFLSALGSCAADIVVVSNEVGQGIVPENALARSFRSAQGHLNQALAAQCETVVTVMAGLPLVLKGELPTEIV